MRLDAPVTIGMAVLCLSKYYMASLWYDHITPKLSNPRLSMMDTDSFVLSADGKSLEDALEPIRYLLDMSNSPEDHPWHTKEQKLVTGYLKEECGWNRKKNAPCFLRIVPLH